jgi:large subunit ribosomal protein L33
MAKKKKPFAKMKCEECKRIHYYIRKSKKMIGEKLELKKYCKWCRKHTLHKEAKK